MAVVEDGSCDGCGETYDLDDLHVITINGEELACCEECRRHAERAAQQSQPECEGCGDGVPESELEAVELPDGVEIHCCQDCRKEASVDLTGDSTSVNSESSGRQGTSGPSTGPDASTSHSARYRSESHRTTRSNGGRTRSSRAESEPTTEISTETESTIANTENVCDNCQESFTIELYQVETIDGRTEEFCPDCEKTHSDWRDNGIRIVDRPFYSGRVQTWKCGYCEAIVEGEHLDYHANPPPEPHPLFSTNVLYRFAVLLSLTARPAGSETIVPLSSVRPTEFLLALTELSETAP